VFCNILRIRQCHQNEREIILIMEKEEVKESLLELTGEIEGERVSIIEGEI